jgi:hypothetical protein
MDNAWKSYLMGWQFSPLSVEKADFVEKGKIRFGTNAREVS